MNKDIRKTVRFNQEEFDTINKKMARIDMTSTSQYIRHMALYGFIVNRDTTQLNLLLNEYEALRKELNAIGTNVNQIAKRLNAGQPIYQNDIDEIKNNIDNFCIKAEVSLDKVVKNEKEIINGLD